MFLEIALDEAGLQAASEQVEFPTYSPSRIVTAYTGIYAVTNQAIRFRSEITHLRFHVAGYNALDYHQPSFRQGEAGYYNWMPC